MCKEFDVVSLTRIQELSKRTIENGLTSLTMTRRAKNYLLTQLEAAMDVRRNIFMGVRFTFIRLHLKTGLYWFAASINGTTNQPKKHAEMEYIFQFIYWRDIFE